MIIKHKTKVDRVKSNFRYMDERAFPVAIVEDAAEFIGRRDQENTSLLC